MTRLPWGPTLVVVAHADDETLGAGGTIARLTAEGTPVTVAVATDSTSAQYPQDSSMQARRWEHFRAAMSALGVEDWVELGARDMSLSSVPGPELAAWVADEVRRTGAETVLTCFPGDANEDHRVVARATGIAVRPRPGSSARQLFWFETPSSTEWGRLQGFSEFSGTVAVDVVNHLDEKLRAFACYQDEVRSAPDPRSIDALRTSALRRGSEWGMAAAEVFQPAMMRLC